MLEPWAARQVITCCYHNIGRQSVEWLHCWQLNEREKRFKKVAVVYISTYIKAKNQEDPNKLLCIILSRDISAYMVI